MTNNKQKTPVEWLIEQFYNNEGMLTSKKLEKALEMEKDQMDAEIIKVCATLSTIKASSYEDGFNDGYMKALRTTHTTGTTNTTVLCTQFISDESQGANLPRCIKCGKPQYQHPIITNTI
jgi:hypothetical protein